MSLEYACIYHEKGLCKKDEEPGYVNHCAFGPCSNETPSRGDLIRRKDDEELARYLFAIIYRDVELDFCKGKPEYEELVDTDSGVPEENCIACFVEYLKKAGRGMPKYIDVEKLQLEPEPIDGVMNGVLMLGNGRAFGKTVRMISEALKSMINNAPAEDVAPVVHGRWIRRGNETKCSRCQFIYYSCRADYNYCPNCGAKMDGGNEDD